jgi:uncharacterized repeat protein (TIGR02543 family)
VLPYLIGRAQHGNISSPETTNDIGVAHTTLNYTVNSVGSAVAIWAEGDGVDNVTSGQRSVVDAGTLVYPGLAPATLVVSPLTIAGNTTNTITVCVTDALGIPLRGVTVGFLYSFTGVGNGSVDGTPNTGTFDHLTGLDGCTQGTSVTSGIGGSSAGGTAGTLTISAAGQSQDITITAPIIHTLMVTVTVDPTDPAGTYSVTLNSNAFSPPTGQGTSCSLTVPGATTVTCSYTFTEGATVALARSPAGPPPSFIGWTGDCANGTGANSSVTMAGDETCTATWGP